MKIIKRLAFVLGMLVGVVSVGMGETESNKIDNKIKEFCGDSGISKCISFYETSCDSGNFWACGILSESLGALDMGDYDIKIDEMICKNYNGSTADIEKIILNLIKYAKEIGKFLAENNVAKTSSAMQEMARIVAQENLFIETAKTLEVQTEIKEKTIHRCMLIGNTYLLGFGIKQNINKGLQYLKKSCNYGYDTACNSLGNIKMK